MSSARTTLWSWGFADSDAFGGECGVEVEGTPAFIGAGVEFSQSGKHDRDTHPVLTAQHLVDVVR
jgi:hypothetical protein